VVLEAHLYFSSAGRAAGRARFGGRLLHRNLGVGRPAHVGSLAEAEISA
jgi:hypothetical protein